MHRICAVCAVVAPWFSLATMWFVENAMIQYNQSSCCDGTALQFGPWWLKPIIVSFLSFSSPFFNIFILYYVVHLNASSTDTCAYIFKNLFSLNNILRVEHRPIIISKAIIEQKEKNRLYRPAALKCCAAMRICNCRIEWIEYVCTWVLSIEL